MKFAVVLVNSSIFAYLGSLRSSQTKKLPLKTVGVFVSI